MNKSSFGRLLVVDSDGCALDAMAVKHRQCFIPATIRIWELQDIASPVTEAALRINLFSRSRGINRFLAQSQLFHLLEDSLQATQLKRLPPMDAIDRWIATTDVLSESSLVKAFQAATDSDRVQLGKFLDWTREVNRQVAQLPCPAAFPGTAEVLEKATSAGAGVYVVSSATRAAIVREWQEAGLDKWISGIFGQEDGTKGQVLIRLLEAAKPGAQAMMVGDSMGDWTAAQEAGTLFYPIIPGEEVESWRTLNLKFLTPFLNGTLRPGDLEIDQKAFLVALPNIQSP